MDPVLRTLLLERLGVSGLDAEARRVIELAVDTDAASDGVRAAGVAALGDRRGVSRDRSGRDAGARSSARADRRGGAQRQRQVLVRRGVRAADDRRAEALGEAPEGVDRDVAVPASHRPDAAVGGARARRVGRHRLAEQEWAHGAGYGDSSGRAAPAAVLAEHGWDRDLPSFRPFLSYAELATMFDTLSSLYDALAPVLGPGRRGRAREAARRGATGLRQPAQGGGRVARDVDRAAGSRRTSARRWSPACSAPANPTWMPGGAAARRA